jgi:hypothetical protein
LESYIGRNLETIINVKVEEIFSKSGFFEKNEKILFLKIISVTRLIFRAEDHSNFDDGRYMG